MESSLSPRFYLIIPERFQICNPKVIRLIVQKRIILRIVPFFHVLFLYEWHHPSTQSSRLNKKTKNNNRKKNLRVIPFPNQEVVAKVHRFQLLGIYDIQHLLCFTTAIVYLLTYSKVFIECHLCAKHCRYLKDWLSLGIEITFSWRDIIYQ